jgi:predicted nuclease with TOPRIM domain
MDRAELKRTLIDGIENLFDVLEGNTAKNKLIVELQDIINSEEFNISKAKLEEVKKELAAKTNYCFVLINEIQTQMKEHNERASRLHEIETEAVHLSNMVLAVDVHFAKIHEDITKLAEGAEFIQAEKVLEILEREVEPATVELPVKVDVDYD